MSRANPSLPITSLGVRFPSYGEHLQTTFSPIVRRFSSSQTMSSPSRGFTPKGSLPVDSIHLGISFPLLAFAQDPRLREAIPPYVRAIL